MITSFVISSDWQVVRLYHLPNGQQQFLTLGCYGIVRLFGWNCQWLDDQRHRYGWAKLVVLGASNGLALYVEGGEAGGRCLEKRTKHSFLGI